MAKSNDTSNVVKTATASALIELKGPVVAASVAIDAMGEAVDQAAVGASWADDRIDPMIKAIMGLATFTSDDASKCNDRLKLIHSIALETSILVDDMGGCFNSERRKLEAKLSALEGGAS